MITAAIAGGLLAFFICSAARWERERIEYVTLSFETAMRMNEPLVIPDCPIGGARYPEMVGDVMNTAAALQLIHERSGR